MQFSHEEQKILDELDWELETGRPRPWHVFVTVVTVMGGIAVLFAGIASQNLVVGAAGFVFMCIGAHRSMVLKSTDHR